MSEFQLSQAEAAVIARVVRRVLKRAAEPPPKPVPGPVARARALLDEQPHLARPHHLARAAGVSVGAAFRAIQGWRKKQTGGEADTGIPRIATARTPTQGEAVAAKRNGRAMTKHGTPLRSTSIVRPPSQLEIDRSEIQRRIHNKPGDPHRMVRAIAALRRDLQPERSH